MRQSSTTGTLLSICKQEMTFSTNLNIWKTLTEVQIQLSSRSIPLIRTQFTEEEYRSNEKITNRNNALSTKKFNMSSSLLKK